MTINPEMHVCNSEIGQERKINSYMMNVGT